MTRSVRLFPMTRSVRLFGWFDDLTEIISYKGAKLHFQTSIGAKKNELDFREKSNRTIEGASFDFFLIVCFRKQIHEVQPSDGICSNINVKAFVR